MMTDEDFLRQRIHRDRQALEAQAPPPHFAQWWHQVRSERERRLESRMALVTAAPATCLLVVGVVSMALGGTWQAALPCCAVAFWLGPQALEAAFEARQLSSARRPAA